MLADFDVKVEVAFDGGFLTHKDFLTWTDISDYVEATEGIEITRGRADELSEVQPSTLKLVLDNSDGRFTPEYADGAYYPNVKRGRPIRVTVTYDDGVLGADDYPRFYGYVNEWPIQWSGVGKHSKVAISATSLAARLGKSAEFRNLVTEEIMAGDSDGLAGVKLYYPLGEPEGAVAAGNASRYPQPQLEVVQVGAGGTIAFGTGTGPGTDEQSAPMFTPVDASNGKYLRMVPVENFGDNWERFLLGTAWEASLSAFVTCSTNAEQTIAVLDTTGVWASYLFLGINSSGHLYVEATKLDGTTVLDTITSSAAITDGEVHHVGIRIEGHEATDTATLYLLLDGEETEGVEGPWQFLSSLRSLVMNRLSVGGGTVNGNGGLFTGTISHVVVVDTPVGELVRHAEAGLTGFEGERTDERIARYARYAGLRSYTYDESLDLGLVESMCFRATSGQTPIALMREVEQTENGMLFDARQDGALEFQGRDRRYDAPTEFTVDVSKQELESALEPKLDDQQLINDATVNRPGGAVVHASDVDSVQEYGYYKVDRTLLTTDDGEVDALAWFLVNFYSEPQVRIPSVTIDLLNAPALIVPDLLFADLGAKFALTGLPEHAPWESTDLFIEGTTERITATSYLLEMHTSPPLLSQVWILDSSVRSQLDSTTVLAL